ncbi:hypothetical protein [Sinisalibacter aestuarii]|uniref:Lipoprotein n=1 Tax=Sinisalibacter aestuarii TaxID=2949426 RepID=A0ABQ5LTC6_9RHOB|nr:hypothetical protein [Sinisalibacter aestuarii]GKY87352.1 hypothetical protein STA1M1_12210 [Sinisalibacter aestuarii]
MKRRIGILGAAALALAACEGGTTGQAGATAGYIQTLPEGVLAIAAPNQDLSAVRIDPADGCYVYRYVGPVETTFLPLRTREGRPICSRPPETAEAAA